ncbi:retrotransposon protein, putative, unclassified [Tanacetum coccineum]
MATMAENVIATNYETLPPVLEKGMYDSWKTRIMLYIRGKDNGEMLRDSVEHGDDKLRYDSDIKAINILLLGLPVDIYTLINHYQTAKEIWDRVKELMEGTKMTKQERESMPYDEFDKFTSEPKESIHSYYLRLPKLINDMNMISMTMTLMQINTKFVNYLQPELSRFVTAAKQSPLLQSYAPTVVPQPPTYQPNTGLAIPTFLSTDDPIASFNKAMIFLSSVYRRQSQGYAGNAGNNQASRARVINAIGNTRTNQPRVIRCYNYKGEGHMAKQCTARKMVKDSERFKDIANFKADHIDAYDLDCDAEAIANAIFMENLSPVGSLSDDTVSPRYDSNTLSEVPHYDTYHDSDVLNSNIQDLGYIENIISTNESYDELKRNNDVISYTDYMLIIGDDVDNYVPPHVQKNEISIKDGHSEQEAYLNRELYTIINDHNRKVKDFEKQVFSQETQMKDLNTHIAFLKKNFETLKQESSEKYEKNIIEILDLEKAKKELENIVFKVARWKQPVLYNGHVLIAKEHNPVSVCDSEETLIVAEESRLKMLENKLFPPVIVSKTKVFPKKLPSTSQVLRNLNNARDLLTKLDECIKRRTTLSPYEIGSWEQSDIKGAFNEDFIPFSDNLKETFNFFEKGFITEVKETKDIFEQMEDEVDQFSLAKKSFEFKKRQILINNDRLLEENIASDIMCTYLHSLNEVDNCGKCKSLDVVLLDLQESNNSLSELKKRFAKLEEYNITLDIAFQNHKEQMILNDHDTKNKQLLVKTINNQSVEINDLKVQLQDKLHVINELKHLFSSKEPKDSVENEKWAPATSHKKNNKPYVDASRTKQTIETITKEHAVKQNTRKTDNTMLPSTGRVSSTNASGSKPKINTKNDKISQPSSRIMMNKIEAHHKKFKSSANKKNHVSDCNANVKSVTLSKNSDTICLSYNECLKWVPTGRMFTLVESKCSSSPSRNTTTKILHNRQIPTTTAIPVNEPYLEVAFRKHTCFVRNLEGVDLLSGSCGFNRYTISMANMMKSSLIISSYRQQHRVSQSDTTKLHGREAARTMLIFYKSPLFLWAEAIATTCYTQNRSLIHTRYDKTLYELLRNRKPELKYLHVFYALCYPTNDFEDLGKLQPKVDIRIFIGYSPSKKAYWIYNKRTRQIMETMNVQFDELTQMASEQHGSGPDLHGLISGQINSGLVLNQVASTSAKLPT